MDQVGVNPEKGTVGIAFGGQPGIELDVLEIEGDAKSGSVERLQLQVQDADKTEPAGGFCNRQGRDYAGSCVVRPRAKLRSLRLLLLLV